MTEQKLTIEQAVALATKFFEAGNFGEAEIILARIIEAAPDSDEARSMLSAIKQSQGDHTSVVGLLTPVLARQPQNDQIRAQLGRVLYSLDRFDEAEPVLRQAVALNASDWASYRILGFVAEKRKDWLAAEENYRRSLELNLAGTGSAICLIRLLTNQLKLGDALDLARLLSTRHPENIVYHYLYGATLVQYAQQGGGEKLAEKFGLASEAVPAQLIQALYDLFSGGACFASGEIKAANLHVRQACQKLEKLGANLPSFLKKPGASEMAKLRGYIKQNALERDDSEDAYQSAEFVSRFYWEYHQVLNEFGPLSNDTTITQSNYLRRARKLLSGELEIDAVANFGCFCASSEHILAQEFPGTRFHGIDRSPQVRELNEQHFKAPNISYHADNMLSWLEHSPTVKNGLLVHMRTAVYCLPAYLERLYPLARRKGYRQILLLENVGFDRNSLAFPRFGTGFEPFILRNWILVHDYPSILERCGYTIHEQALVPLVNVTIGLLGAPTPEGKETLMLGGWLLPDMHLMCLHATAAN